MLEFLSHTVKYHADLFFKPCQEIREETNNMAEMQPKSTDSNKNKKKDMARRKKAVIT
jgi:hypothetical protein